MPSRRSLPGSRWNSCKMIDSELKHDQILHNDVTNRIKWRISSRKSQKKLFSPSLSLDKTIIKAYFMVTKNRMQRFLSINNRTLSQKMN